MSELVMLEPKTWKEVLDGELTYLMLGKHDCPACEQWTAELSTALADGQSLDGVTYAKLFLDDVGWGRFKMANPWVANVDVLPFNAIYVNGEAVKQWAGGGMERMQNRLSRYLS